MSDTAAKPIRLAYRSIDGHSASARFKTLKGARKWAHEWIGANADCGRSYAVSFDGVGKIMVLSGTTIEALFAPEVAASKEHAA